MIRIKEIWGYTLSYDERLRRFIITDTDSTELAHSEKQDDAEAKAKALSKQEFKRIPIINVSHGGYSARGELTSLNKDDKSAWVSIEKAEGIFGSGRQKINLKYDSGYYEVTEENLKILDSIIAEREIVDNALEAISSLIGTLEKQLGLGYFGIKG